MDVKERLTHDDLARPDYLSASHVHRYTLAAELCRGLRVLDLGCGIGYGSRLLCERAESVLGIDVDPEAVETAREGASGPALEFETADALERLRGLEGDDFGAIVMLEALEHVPDPDAVLAELRRLAASGTRLVVSLPNSRMFHEDNPFHATDYDYVSAERAFAGFARVVWLDQFLTEGSLIVRRDEHTDGRLAGRVAARANGEPEYANTYLAAVGFDEAAVLEATVEFNLVSVPSHNRYMLELEAANAELRRTNRQLARGIYGKHDAAAATLIARHQAEVWERDQELDAARRENDDLRRRLAEVEAALHQEWAWKNAGRYHLTDRAVQTVQKVPGLYPLLKGAHRRARRRDV